MSIDIIADQKFANSVPIAMILVNDKNLVVWWNNAAENILHLNKKKSFLLKKLFSESVINQLRHSRIPIETILEINPQTHISLSAVPYAGKYLLLFIQDITHLHNLERIRQDFVANVSHELRTPLTVLHGYLETLIDQTSKNNKPLKKIFAQMYQQSSRMEKLVEDLLLLSRLETVAPKKEAFKLVNIPALLTRIAKDAKELSGVKKHKIHLSMDKNLKIYGIEDELISAFANLIFNAVNYTPEKGEIFIRWFCDQGHAYMQVKDTGIGIATVDIPRITERFFRVDRARSRASGGTGLGLAIVKHALIHHNAQLKIESELGKGSTFSCIFPKELIHR